MTSQTSAFDGIDIPNAIASMQASLANHLVLDEILHEYLLKFPGHWIGVEDGEPTVAPTLRKLLKLLDDPGTAAIRRLVEFRLIPTSVRRHEYVV
jgi:hypothetical protein